jgi:hypothetical protein
MYASRWTYILQLEICAFVSHALVADTEFAPGRGERQIRLVSVQHRVVAVLDDLQGRSVDNGHDVRVRWGRSRGRARRSRAGEARGGEGIAYIGLCTKTRRSVASACERWRRVAKKHDIICVPCSAHSRRRSFSSSVICCVR